MINFHNHCTKQTLFAADDDTENAQRKEQQLERRAEKAKKKQRRAERKAGLEPESDGDLEPRHDTPVSRIACLSLLSLRSSQILSKTVTVKTSAVKNLAKCNTKLPRPVVVSLDSSDSNESDKVCSYVIPHPV